MGRKDKADAGNDAKKEKRFVLIRDDALREKVRPWLAIACCAVGLVSAYIAMSTGHPVFASFCCFGGMSAGMWVYTCM